MSLTNSRYPPPWISTTVQSTSSSRRYWPVPTARYITQYQFPQRTFLNGHELSPSKVPDECVKTCQAGGSSRHETYQPIRDTHHQSINTTESTSENRLTLLRITTHTQQRSTTPTESAARARPWPVSKTIVFLSPLPTEHHVRIS